jgi:four helix bundle protein
MNGRKIERVEEMPVFQRFHELAVEIEKATRGFRPDFRWLRVQVLRSSESVCANMTEGFYSQYSTEYLQALHRCRREARETLAHLRYAADTGNLPAQLLGDLHGKNEDALQQLAAVIASIERKLNERGKAKPGASVVKEADAKHPVSMNHFPFPSSIPHPPSPMNHSP